MQRKFILFGRFHFVWSIVFSFREQFELPIFLFWFQLCLDCSCWLLRSISVSSFGALDYVNLQCFLWRHESLAFLFPSHNARLKVQFFRWHRLLLKRKFLRMFPEEFFPEGHNGVPCNCAKKNVHEPSLDQGRWWMVGHEPEGLPSIQC